MKEEKAELAAEMSGHIFFADRYFGYDDAIYSSCRLLEIIAASGKTVSQLISDIPKTLCYRLARHINKREEIIPHRVLTRPPSAELRPDQTDQDSLPPYDLLDHILQLYLLDSYTLEQITAAGFEEQLVKQVLTMVGKAEFKRRQAPPVLKVSPRAFGTGRRIPIARSIHEA